MNKPHVVTARVLIEPGTESLERTRNYVIQALKMACKNIRDGNVVIALYDEDDQLLGVDVTGSPSSVLQGRIDSLFEEYERGSLKPAP